MPALKDNLSGVPLLALTAVVLDTETTGLNVAEDRIVEIGAVRLGSGTVEDGFSRLVNPGVPIPEQSIAVHGISDVDVAEEPDFRDVWRAFADWSDCALVIGYSIGFDIAILCSEHARRGMDWTPPRVLDVRHLVQLLSPNLPEESLEMTAAWLGIEIQDRHRALGDAKLTAEIFVALLPKLLDRGISTLSQAERACRSLSDRREMETRAGWHLSPETPVSENTSFAEYARVDSFPYRYRTGQLMHAPPCLVDGELSLRQALKTMEQAGTSSLFLNRDAGGDGSYGIVTERDVMRALRLRDSSALDAPVGEIGSRPLLTVGADEFVYRALVAMASKNIRHLGVVDGDGELVGALSARDLLQQRAGDAISLGDSIEAANTATQLGRVWGELTAVVGALVREGIDARTIAAIVSRELRALTKRATEIAEVELLRAGDGAPPVPYCMLVLGSGGRGESLLAMDQDNAILFERGDPGGEADQWFARLGHRVADILNQSGVSYCKGGIMGSNAEWRMDLDGWRRTVGQWIARSRPEDILNCDIFFDAVAVHGETALADTLRAEALELAADARPFLKALALNASNFSTPVGLFRRFKLSDGRLDLKLGGIMPIFSAARVVALENSVQARATPDRLAAVKSLTNVPAKTIEDLIEAHRVLLNLILKQQLADIAEGIPLSNKVAPGALSSAEKDRLHWALEKVPAVRDLLGTPAMG